MPPSMTAPTASLELELALDWRHLRHLRQFVQHLISVATSDEAAAVRVAMALTELAENAVKYALPPTASIRVKVTPGEGIRLETENRTSGENLQKLDRVLAEVSAGTPAEAYARALHRASLESADSQVGLARVRCEGGLELRREVEGSKVRVIAEQAHVHARTRAETQAQARPPEQAAPRSRAKAKSKG